MSAQDTRQRLGKAAESLVAQYLRDRGFEIVGQNLRLGALEVDIVATKARICVVCEVRSRRSASGVHPAETITAAKRDRVRRAASALMKRQDLRGLSLRLDVAAVTGATTDQPIIDYYENAL